eukprot:CAMPEP_0202900678 /NCGR_PEP_ID=MMETSP1392-20130828/11978_1 /ASSEMBLY_ACC=CAM_ASM_000868 /TAXON_ID=225041 /ORGANISM="Chlamydomonas chlamydogama, Strain SAG 11-48b" /LENGTH=79 /DNA_ID=CAMNT_0049587117 /DNA_START=161 /DNA_END=400 /DNA_ORIENTATION=+
MSAPSIFGPASKVLEHDRYDMLQAAEAIGLKVDRDVLEHIMEITAAGCHSKDVKEYLRAVVSRAAPAGNVPKDMNATQQ